MPLKKKRENLFHTTFFIVKDNALICTLIGSTDGDENSCSDLTPFDFER